MVRDGIFHSRGAETGGIRLTAVNDRTGRGEGRGGERG